MHRLTRKALFDMAWSRPLTQVAADFGVTSTALKKTCDRHDIPTPSRGYWAQVAAGRSFPRPKLRAAKSPEQEEVRIVGGAPIPEVAQIATKAAKAKLAPITLPDTPAAAAEEPAVIGALRKALAKAKPDEAGFIRLNGRGLVPIVASLSTAERALTWLSQFLALAAAQGCDLDRSGEVARLLVEGEPLAFSLEEKSDKAPHSPTPKELAEKARREKWGYSSSADPWPKYDHLPSGRLSLVIDANAYSGLRKSFADGKTQSLEAMTGEILAAFAGHAALIAERRRQAEDAKQRAAIEQARRERIRAFEEREARRGKFADAVASLLAEREKLQRVRAHLDQLVSGDLSPPTGMAAWLDRQIAQLDALVSAGFLRLSAQSAKIDFDEARAAANPEPSWAYPRAVELHFWSIDLAKDEARMQSSLEWALAAGLIADPGRAPDA